MRDINRIDRSKFPARLCEELERYRADLESQNRSPQTQDTYCNHLEGFFHFALSDQAPETHRPIHAEIAFVHIASRPLWEAYFRHLTDVGRRTIGPDYLISRASVERMKAVSAVFCPDRGFMTKNKDIFSHVSGLGEAHLPGLLVGHLNAARWPSRRWRATRSALHWLAGPSGSARPATTPASPRSSPSPQPSFACGERQQALAAGESAEPFVTEDSQNQGHCVCRMILRPKSRSLPSLLVSSIRFLRVWCSTAQ